MPTISYHYLKKPLLFVKNNSRVTMELHLPIVTWWKALEASFVAKALLVYLMMPVLMLCATVNGYDGRLVVS
jgi:hypothetical protein